ncbi:hypothetical protein LTR53_003207 [Teratosphaeriaceae sp. CCFEE 6253]|nr:hypothetical protein LTR53_003207 [Teratosphaeriaceae sp. CCFEE 6253]
MGSLLTALTVWGTLVITTPACKSFAGIAANRFLLGASEAVVNPGFVLVLSMCYAIGHITTGLQQWQYIFLIFGAISISWGVIFLIFMPDLPSSAGFLNDRAKVVAVERVAANRQGVKNSHWKTYQMWQCAQDPKTWILFFMSIAAQIPNAAQSSFTSLILKGFGFDTLQTQYMQMPGNAIQIVSLLLSGYVASRWPNTRCIVMIAGNLICVGAGGALVGLSPQAKWGRLVALWLCSCQSVVNIHEFSLCARHR